MILDNPFSFLTTFDVKSESKQVIFCFHFAVSSMNYFRELLDRIREIRLSERVFYQQIKDIYTTSIDYNPADEMTLAFYKEVQNKLLWAVSGKTVAELIYYRANATLPQMGLTATSLPNKVPKTDIEIGKII